MREALKVLERNRLIESRPNVGWFAMQVNESNLTQAKEMAGSVRQIERSARSEPPTGPIRLPTAPEKPIRIPKPSATRNRTAVFD